MTSAPTPDLVEVAGHEVAARVATLFERHGRMVYGLCRAMLRDGEEAEDATQQTFLLAHRALRGGVHVRDAPAWLAAIARNECRARIVAHMREPLPLVDEDLEALASPVDEVERRLHAEAVRRALAALPERQREAFVLRYLYGLRYGEVATALGLSRPATEALLFRARRAMRVGLRPVVGAALVVPLAVREELALAIPGFAPAGSGGAAVAGVVASGGLVAKLATASVAAKVATATVAVTTVGAIGAADSERAARDRADRLPVASSMSAIPDAGAQSRRDDPSGGEDDHGGTSGSSGHRDDGHGGEARAEDRGDDSGSEVAGDSSGSGSGLDDTGDDTVESSGSTESSESLESLESSGPSGPSTPDGETDSSGSRGGATSGSSSGSSGSSDSGDSSGSSSGSSGPSDSGDSSGSDDSGSSGPG